MKRTAASPLATHSLAVARCCAQDLDEAKTTVEKRLQYIGDEMLFALPLPACALYALSPLCRACMATACPQAAAATFLLRAACV